MGPPIFDVIRELCTEDMRLPVVYNCGGYERVEFLSVLEGLVDIYMPDVKFGNDAAGCALTRRSGSLSELPPFLNPPERRSR
jgi:putative pyruvate formate lyase activating enzyme